jgi:proton-dependent oligopeptide transporter, POT family
MERLAGFFRSLADYNRSFWSANISELFERLAFYGMTPILVAYLTEVRDFDGTTAIRLSGNFGLVTYGLAAASGFLADMMGYRRAMMLAYAFLATGYFLTGQATGYVPIVGALLLVAFGASLIKPAITGTVQKTCADEAQRTVGFSIYYTLVNIGGFLGPILSGLVAGAFGVERVFWFSASAAGLALGLVFFAFQEPGRVAGDERPPLAFLGDFARVLTNVRLVLLFLFVAGFWSMFFQFYGALPLYLRDDLGVSPQWRGLIISTGAGAIILLQVIVGYLSRKMVTAHAILLGIVISSIGVSVIGWWPSAVLAGIGVFSFALGEMVYSAHFYKYLGSLAPPGQTGMYLGFAFLPIALGSFIAGQIGGPVAEYFRDTLGQPERMWWAFAAVGLASAAGLALMTFVFKPRAAA